LFDIDTHAFPQLLWITYYIQNIVCDLKYEAKVLAIIRQ